jgi:hypothetical protein
MSVPVVGCNLIAPAARGKLSTAAVDKSAEKLWAGRIFRCFLNASQHCPFFGQFFRSLISQGIISSR